MSTKDADQSIVIGVPEDVDAVPEVRAELAGVALGWGLGDVETMEVVIAELVTNAIVHAHSSPIVRLSRSGPEQVLLEVTDGRPELPVHVVTYANHTRGLGLHIVDALSHEWGVHAGDQSKTVWSEIDLSPDGVGHEPSD